MNKIQSVPLVIIKKRRVVKVSIMLNLILVSNPQSMHTVGSVIYTNKRKYRQNRINSKEDGEQSQDAVSISGLRRVPGMSSRPHLTTQ